jgi:hypothetical protein
MRLLLPLVACLAVSGPALACINYSESANHEREFRSQYQDSQYTPPEPTTVSSAKSYVLGGAGIFLTLASAALYLRIRPRD